MRILLTEDDVSQALQDYISHMVVLGDNTESRVELAMDGSAEVIVMPVGKPAPKTASKSTGRKSKAPAKTQKAAEPEPEPDTETETAEEASAKTDALAEEEKPVETTVAPAEEKNSPFSFGSKMKDVPEEGGSTEAPRPVGSSIFSKVGKAG